MGRRMGCSAVTVQMLCRLWAWDNAVEARGCVTELDTRLWDI
jgi:hypothetical protein